MHTVQNPLSHWHRYVESVRESLIVAQRRYAGLRDEEMIFYDTPREFLISISYNDSKMLFPKLELDPTDSSLLTSLLDIPRSHIRPTKVHPDLTLPTPIQTRQITLVQNPLAHPHKQTIEIRPSKIRPRRQLRQRILVRPDRVQDDILRRVGIHALRQVRVDPQELLLRAGARHA
jgi:hypothetical protein